MTNEEIHNIYLHMTGKAEGIAEATGTADFPVLFARAILEFNRMEREAEKQEPVIDKTAAIRIATALGWKPAEQCPDCEYNKARAARWRAEAYKHAGYDMIELPWVGLTDDEIQAILDKPEPFYDTMFWFARKIEQALKEKNT